MTAAAVKHLLQQIWCPFLPTPLGSLTRWPAADCGHEPEIASEVASFCTHCTVHRSLPFCRLFLSTIPFAQSWNRSCDPGALF